MRKYTDEQLIEAIKTSFSIREVLNKLGVNPNGGNYYSFNKNRERLDLDISHFDGGRTFKLNNPPKPIPLEELLVLGSNTKNRTIKKRLFTEGLKKHICEYCGFSEWMGEPIPLELEHVNGNNCDNRIENLKIICPNCHALTPTYRGRNARLKRQARESSPNFIPDPKIVRKNSKKAQYSPLNPGKDILLELLIKNSWNFKEAATEYKVSVFIFRKWCVNNGLPSNKKEFNAYQASINPPYVRPDNNPGRETLLAVLNKVSWNFSKAGRELNVSDNCVRKWCRKNELPSNRKEIIEWKGK